MWEAHADSALSRPVGSKNLSVDGAVGGSTCELAKLYGEDKLNICLRHAVCSILFRFLAQTAQPLNTAWM